MSENNFSKLETHRFDITPESGAQMKDVRQIFLSLKEKYPELRALSFYGSRIKGKETETSDLDCYLFYNADELPEEHKKQEKITKINEYRNGTLAKDFLEKINQGKKQGRLSESLGIHTEPVDISREKTQQDLEWFTTFIQLNFWNGTQLDTLLTDRVARGLAGRFLLSVGDVYETRKQILEYFESLPNGQDYLQGLMWVLSSIERPKSNNERSFPALPEYAYPWTIAETKKLFLKKAA